jgi:hypothetical protein
VISRGREKPPRVVFSLRRLDVRGRVAAVDAAAERLLDLVLDRGCGLVRRAHVGAAVHLDVELHPVVAPDVPRAQLVPPADEGRPRPRRPLHVRVEDPTHRLVVARVLLVDELAERSAHHAHANDDEHHRHQDRRERVEPREARHAHGEQCTDRREARERVRHQVPAVPRQRRGPGPPSQRQEPPPERAVREHGRAHERQAPVDPLHADVAREQPVRRLPHDAGAGGADQRALHAHAHELEAPVPVGMRAVRGPVRLRDRPQREPARHHVDDRLHRIAIDRGRPGHPPRDELHRHQHDARDHRHRRGAALDGAGRRSVTSHRRRARSR